MNQNWESPKISDVIILKDGYEDIKPSGKQHYGLVVCVFKLEDEPSKRYIMFAPGKTRRPEKPLKNTDLLIPAWTFGNSNDTVFQFAQDVVAIDEYPSDRFVQSVQSRVAGQPGQQSCTIANIEIKGLQRISNDVYKGNILNLYKFVLSEYGITQKIKNPKNLTIPAQFLES